MYTYVNHILCILCLCFSSCKRANFEAPNRDKFGFIDLNSMNFCAAFDVGDSLKMKYELTLPSKKAVRIIESLQDFSGIEQDLIIFQGNVPNALATTYEDKKIIIYNKDFIEDADKLSRTDFWQSTFILAHEIGHHLYGHVLSNDSTIRYRQELQADKFAGFLLYRMGAKQDQSTWIMISSLLQDSRVSITHPQKAVRFTAIIDGWQKAFDQAFTIPIPPPPDFDPDDPLNFFDNNYFNCSELLSDSSIYRFHSEFMNGCQLDSIISNGLTGFEQDDELVSEMILRDTLTGVILNLEEAKYDEDLGFLVSSDARVRIIGYQKNFNPNRTNLNVYVKGISCPDPREGAWNYFTKVLKPGQWIKFKLIVENATVITPTYRLSYLSFIAPPKK